MRLADLLGREVVDLGGRRLGHVHDVRLRREGPDDGPLTGYVLDALVVGPRALAHRWGYATGVVERPAALRRLLTGRSRQATLVPWADVDLVDDVIVRRGGDDR